MEKLYTTDLKYIIPLIGILTAWILTSIANLYTNINSNKKTIGKAIVQLHFIYFEVEKLLALCEYIKDVSGINQSFEILRKSLVDRYSLSKDTLNLSVEIIGEISTLYPTIGIELKSLIEGYSFRQKVSFDSTSSVDKDSYIKLLSIYEATFALDNSVLKKIILKLSWKHSFWTWISMRRKYKKMNKTGYKELADKFGLVNDAKHYMEKVFIKPKGEQNI